MLVTSIHFPKLVQNEFKLTEIQPSKMFILVPSSDRLILIFYNRYRLFVRLCTQ